MQQVKQAVDYNSEDKSTTLARVHKSYSDDDTSVKKASISLSEDRERHSHKK